MSQPAFVPMPHRTAAAASLLTDGMHALVSQTDVVEPLTCTPVRLVLAGGQPLFRDGLRELLQTNAAFRVIGETRDGESTLHFLRKHQPDILLLNLPLPGESAMEILRELFSEAIPVRVLLLTNSLETVDLLMALQFGVRGILLKSSATREMLFEAVREVRAGHYWVGRESISSLAGAVRELSTPEPSRQTRVFGLTSRELEIVASVAKGYSNAEIAEALALSVQTVKHHLSHIFDKLGVYNRLELALFAVNHALIRGNP